jgi:hypothetical protein
LTETEAPPSAALVGASCAEHGDRGATFVCTRCGDFACDECAFSRVPEREVCRRCAAHGLAEPIPWERRKELGWRKAYWETTKAVLRDPTRFYKTPSTEEGLMGPMMYGVLAYTVGQTLYAALMAVLLLGAGGVSAVMVDEQGLGGFLLAYFGCLGLGVVPLTLLQAPVQSLFGIVVAGGCAHLTLMMLKSTKGTLEASLRAVCYANAAYILMVIPCFGALALLGYELWAEVAGMREAHRIGTDKAVLAVVGFRVLLILLIVGFYVAFFAVTLAAGPPTR